MLQYLKLRIHFILIDAYPKLVEMFLTRIRQIKLDWDPAPVMNIFLLRVTDFFLTKDPKHWFSFRK